MSRRQKRHKPLSEGDRGVEPAITSATQRENLPPSADYSAGELVNQIRNILLVDLEKHVEKKPNELLWAKRAFFAALLFLLAGWLATNSLGLVVGGLRTFSLIGFAISGVLLIVGAVPVFPSRGTRCLLCRLALLSGVLIVLAIAISTNLSHVAVFALALVVIGFAALLSDITREILTIVAATLTIFGGYRLALAAVPFAWFIVDGLSEKASTLTSFLTGTAVALGPSFAGWDILLVSGLFGWGLAGCRHPKPRVARVTVLLGLLAIQLGYWVLVAYIPHFLAWLPPVPEPPNLDMYTPTRWYWQEEIRRYVPWNLPLVLALAQLGWLGAWFYSWGLKLHKQADSKGGESVKEGWLRRLFPLASPLFSRSIARRQAPVAQWIICLLVVICLSALVAINQGNLRGRIILIHEGGFLDWEGTSPVRPDSFGSCIALPKLVESLGGQVSLSKELTADELQRADVVVIVHPDRAWPQERLERVRQYVREGGSLLLTGGTFLKDGDRASHCNQLLEGLGIVMAFETVIHANPGRDETMEAFWHPTTAGFAGCYSPWGFGVSASLAAEWPVRPLLLARWAWADPGSDAVLTNVFRLEPGERLGDVLLAAERPLGRGRVVVLSDSLPISDSLIASSSQFIGGLLSYLAEPGGAGYWRETVLGLMLLGIATILLLWPREITGEALVLLGVGLWGTSQLAAKTGEVIFDGRLHPGWNNVACLDLGHLNQLSREPWAPNGLAGFCYTLLRCGYLPVALEKLEPRQLECARWLISIAPNRRFSAGEQRVIRQFIQNGGIFVAMVGADRSFAVRSFFRELGLDPGEFPIAARRSEPEPEPMGCTLTLYRAGNVDYDSRVLFYAAWPVGCLPTEHLVRARDNLPVVAVRSIGQGKFVLIGDAFFALNTNLWFTEEPVNAQEINGNFWRWFLSWFTEQPDWSPPPEQETEAGPKNEETS